MSAEETILDATPDHLARSTDVQLLARVVGLEVDRLRAALDLLRGNFTAINADLLLATYEEQYKLPINPAGRSYEQRRAAIIAAMQRTFTSGTGADWKAKLTQFLGTNWEYIEGEDGGTPDSGIVQILLPFGDSIDPPENLAVGTKTAGGLANDTYYWRVTAVNIFGETTGSDEISSTVTGGNGTVPLTWDEVAGAASYKVYRGTESGEEFLVASAATNGYTDTGVAASDEALPLTNTTKPYTTAQAEKIARAITPAHIQLNFGYSDGFIIGVSRIGEDTL